MLTGYGISPKMLKAIKEKTPFFVSENFRRLPEDLIFTGEVRQAAGIQIRDMEYFNQEHDQVFQQRV
jgi:hypothetical protein